MFIARGATCLLLLLCLVSCASDPVALVPEKTRGVPGKGSIAIDQDGNLYIASGQAVSKWDGEGHAVPFSAAAAEVVVADEEFLYCAGEGQIRRFTLANRRLAQFAGGSAGISIDSVQGLDVAGAILYVAAGDKIRMFDTTSGAAAGEFDVHAPAAVAVDPLGQIWVAHDHSVVQAFRADGYSGVTYGGLGEVVALTFGPGARLYAADAASGRVLVLDTGASPAQFVPVLSLSGEAGRLCAVVADGRGNLITLQRRADGKGERLAKYGADRKMMWEVKR
jgi:DNA-binding beta-propeller fold protein YncE